MEYKGFITKGIGGFYYVETVDGVFECKAKGKFRKERITPLAGDKVKITVREDKENTIDEIFTRKNSLARPPVANIDVLMIVVSTCNPVPSTLIIDKMTVVAEKNNIEPIILITKTDLAPADELVKIYSKTGYKVFTVSTDDMSSLDEIKSYLAGKLTAFTGNSGVGKSTFINALCPGLNLETNEISDKLGRGRHTTRHAEIFHIGDCLIIDTAGFSSLDFLGNGVILKDDLQYYFKEFSDYIGTCRFSVSCSHVADKGCKICEAVESGSISKSRHDSYISMYNEVKNINEWEV
ncbi:MAG: ribosome small subunit-dependent GTPase A [Faecalibacterium sp.]|nr:ribosome small subunit-dependent GTPase A [Ruminococcus sp.]MCM1392992.1 ribosome small subunit-dependent GTPase A [Ruminococcus sp.]MCM1484926.1 ribosome small subunit-dependent GTPase A [Faecalibacterium sp.]